MHFDEVYHARTATEFLQDWRYGISHDIYEWTHPHMAKYAMALGIVAFGEDKVSAESRLGVSVVDAVIEPRRDESLDLAAVEGDRLWVATGSEVRAYDLATRDLAGTLAIPDAVALAYDKTGQTLYVGTRGGEIRAVDVTARRRDRRGHRSRSSAVRAASMARSSASSPATGAAAAVWPRASGDDPTSSDDRGDRRQGGDGDQPAQPAEASARSRVGTATTGSPSRRPTESPSSSSSRVPSRTRSISAGRWAASSASTTSRTTPSTRPPPRRMAPSSRSSSPRATHRRASTAPTPCRARGRAGPTSTWPRAWSTSRARCPRRRRDRCRHDLRHRAARELDLRGRGAAVRGPGDRHRRQWRLSLERSTAAPGVRPRR